MSRKTVIATSAATLGCALAIGFFMQLGSQPLAVPETLAPVKVEQTHLEPQIIDIGPDPYEVAELDLSQIQLTSADPLEATTPTAEEVVEPVAFQPDSNVAAPIDPVTPHLGCAVTATATAAPMASVLLTVDAPCNSNERLTVHHNGMMFTQTTSASGQLSVTIPALSKNAVFIVDFDSGKGVVATAQVPDIASFDRVAVQWTGDIGFQIHAREFGAAYGSPGHVWWGSDQRDSAGSQVIRLGDLKTLNPKMAEIYTFPLASATRSGKVALTVETEVTRLNCGRDIAAQSIEMRGPGKLRTQDLTLSVPDCTAVGDFLVLNNLVDDLKIAAK